MTHLLDGEKYAFESQIRECFGRAAYGHKTHEKMAEKHSAHLGRIKIGQIIVSALTAGGAVTLLFDKTPSLPYVTALLSVLTLILNTYVKDIDPATLAQRHREAATDIWNIRESYVSILTDLRDSSISVADLRKRRDDLQNQLYKLYRAVPLTRKPSSSVLSATSARLASGGADERTCQHNASAL